MLILPGNHQLPIEGWIPQGLGLYYYIQYLNSATYSETKFQSQPSHKPCLPLSKRNTGIKEWSISNSLISIYIQKTYSITPLLGLMSISNSTCQKLNSWFSLAKKKKKKKRTFILSYLTKWKTTSFFILPLPSSFLPSYFPISFLPPCSFSFLIVNK